MSAHNKIELPRDELERLYIGENLSSNAIAKLYGCDGLTVISRLREYEIPIKPRGWQKLVRRVPDSVLSNWPSSELAYVAGLIASDGNLQKQNNCIILVSIDREVVETFAKLLRVQDPHIIVSAQGGRRKPAYVFQICDYAFRAFAENLGLTPNKTSTIGKLKIPDGVFADFVRGELDGDGSWYIARGWRGIEYLCGKFTSKSQTYLEWLQATVARLSGIEGRLQKARLYYNGKKAEQLGEWLYYSVNVPCLRRKRNTWESWIISQSHRQRTAGRFSKEL